ncbi:MAGUK p55 subfamily member 5-A [Operophtera brumata]|uniref:MAGUK p55 subfamily member 5-A n=1 Tax=Operophtera brumata TaxID=104452 RepID=A0A0L7KVZ9_OPEBR|nr:MAGUK p55 subfamily member 5-A [Operophtera brumata]
MLLKEQLRQRKEAEERIAAQNEFLRTSLRGSNKLQALESTPPSSGTAFVNDAYEDDISDDSSQMYAALGAGGESALAARVASAASTLLCPALRTALATRGALLSILGGLELESLIQAHDQAAALLDPACFTRGKRHKTGNNLNHKENDKSISTSEESNVCQVLGALSGTLCVMLAPRARAAPLTPPHRVLHVRAHFDYDPEDDVYIPCRELGISFQKGDVLHVISREDPNWWQAFREGEEDQTLAEYEQEEILTYEEVALYYPRASHKRPIVLIDTSRPRKDHEVPGQDYHFISRTQFESDILNRKFVEHGEYEKAYYGTSLEAIREVVNSGKICVLNLHPQSLKILRGSDLKPYTVFVAPPSLEKLRQKKIRNGEAYKEEELKEIIATARDMELRWGHLFDMIIINNDTQRAYQQLLNEINSLEREPQWVPAHWLKHT